MSLPDTIINGLAVQYSTDGGATWTIFGQGHDLGTILRTRRFSVPPGHTVTAAKWRVIRQGATDLTGSVMSLGAVGFRTETALLSPARAYNFDFDIDTQRYVLVSTVGNIDVYKNDVWQAAIATPYAVDQVTAATRVQRLDTFIGFHPAVAPLKLTRQGSDDEWDSRSAVFKNVPLFDYTGKEAGGVNEQQQILFDSYVNGDTFNITLEDFTTDPIVYSSTAATMEASLTSALEALDNVGPGGVSVTSPTTDTYVVTFVGDNAAEDIGIMAPETLHSDKGGVFAANLVQGMGGGEAIFSAARGYPACGAFYQQRLYLGGLASQPQTILGSVIGDFFNFNGKGRPTAAAINETLDTSEATVIKAIYPGRHLQVFCAGSEAYFPTEPIVSPAGIKLTTKRGSQSATPIGDMDGASVFVSRGGGGLCKFQFDTLQESYTAPWLNVLAPTLVTGVIDMAFRRALNPKETDQALLVRGDGLLAVMMALLDQNVVGFSRWTTQGQFVAACADIAGDMHVITQRTFGGVTENYLEAVDLTAYLDHQVSLVVDGDPVEAMALPTHLAGETVTLIIDGADAGDRVAPALVGGVCTLELPWPALREVAAGCLFVPLIKSLPLITQDPRPAIDRQMRTGQIACQLGPTVGLRVGIDGDRDWPMPLTRRGRGAAADTVTPFEGWDAVRDIPGFAEEESVVMTQPRPGPLNIRQLAVTVDT